MRLSSLAAAASLLLAVTPALAQGTAAQRAACTSDAMRLCSSHIPNVGAITSCLRREKASLSTACRSVMDAAEAPAQRTAEVERAPAPAAAPRLIPRRMVRSGAVARAEAPATIRHAGPRRIAAQPRTVRTAAVRRRSGTGRMAGFAGLGGRSSEMRQAMYWMNRLGGLSGMMGGMAGAGGGMSLDAIRDVRIGDLMGMME
ncbi:hypothetical protein [Methylobacterium aquaticum]|uniref:Uncharacterized protein n=1 Tax=Methylobacterium aquaticum TaxID=270351 RepID=A0A0J6S8Z6_9HYPH|nr:hypothetical protein VP06_22870 [Methylobacterium aquaticum]